MLDARSFDKALDTVWLLVTKDDTVPAAAFEPESNLIPPTSVVGLNIRGTYFTSLGHGCCEIWPTALLYAAVAMPVGAGIT